MTDNEIMKSVRCCADNYCKGCSLQGKSNCKNTLFSFAWNTMYNQKAEIERLTNKCDNCAGCTDWKCDCANERANAIEEFAERLKKSIKGSIEDAWHGDGSGYYYADDVLNDIDNLIEEMVGGSK